MADVQTGTVVAGTTYGVGYSYMPNSFISAVGGTLSATDTSGTPPPSLTTLYVGGISPLNGGLTKLKYYPLRASNTQLQLLTQ